MRYLWRTREAEIGEGPKLVLSRNRSQRKRLSAMARTYLVFGDIEGKLDVLRVECTKCARKGCYRVRRLIEKYGRKANMMKWKEQLGLPEARCTRPAQTLRFDMSRSAEGVIET
jgi:hypothetical protein